MLPIAPKLQLLYNIFQTQVALSQSQAAWFSPSLKAMPFTICFFYNMCWYVHLFGGDGATWIVNPALKQTFGKILIFRNSNL